MRRLRWLLRQARCWLSPPYRVREVTELPEKVDPRVLYVVGENGYRWYVAMHCPCGCGEVLYLNTRTDAHPYWKITPWRTTLSLSPSIWRVKGCRSHFFLRRGRVLWCE